MAAGRIAFGEMIDDLQIRMIEEQEERLPIGEQMKRTRIQYVRRALDEIAGPDPKLVAQVNAIDAALHDIDDRINGDPILRRANEPNLPSLLDRVRTAVTGLTTTSPPTATHREALTLARQQTGPLLERLHKLIDIDLANVEKEMNAL